MGKQKTTVWIYSQQKPGPSTAMSHSILRESLLLRYLLHHVGWEGYLSPAGTPYGSWGQMRSDLCSFGWKLTTEWSLPPSAWWKGYLGGLWEPRSSPWAVVAHMGQRSSLWGKKCCFPQTLTLHGVTPLLMAPRHSEKDGEGSPCLLETPLQTLLKDD